jgi:Ricin-type beta-trefoil lectin domain/CHAP domain
VRPISRYPSRQQKLDQKGVAHHGLTLVICSILCLAVIFTFRAVISHAASASPAIRSGISGYCLDDHKDSVAANAVVDSWRCNESQAQAWSAGVGTIEHDQSYCLSVANDAKTAGTNIVLNSCDQAPGQIWLRDKSGYENPNSGLCLSLPNDQTGKQLVLASCQQLDQTSESWTLTSANGATVTGPDCNALKSEGTKVACYADQEWTNWQSSSSNHEALLNSYTDGAPYEEWCADFVSYIYKEAGYPFTGGETNGWDENIADNIQNENFTMHQAGSYVPVAGDVAFFDYAGGHVEIVVSGGKTPTYVYGNSAIIDPTTGNGEMAANTISNDGAAGQVTYYLSPN